MKIDFTREELYLFRGILEGKPPTKEDATDLDAIRHKLQDAIDEQEIIDDIETGFYFGHGSF